MWSIFRSVFDGLQPVASTYALAKLISSVSAVAANSTAANHVYFWLGSLLTLELLRLSISSINRLIEYRQRQRIEINTNEIFFKKMYELSQEQYSNEKFNTKLARARESLYDVGRVTKQLSWAFSSAITSVASIAAIFAASPMVGVIIACTVIPVALLHTSQNRKREDVYKKIEPYERIAYRSRWMLIDPNHMPEIRLLNAFKDLLATWQSKMKKAQDIEYAFTKKFVVSELVANSIQPAISFATNVYFFRQLLAGLIGIDKFFFLRGMLEQATNGAESVASSLRQLHELLITLKNFNDIHNTEPAIPNGTSMVEAPLQIEFKNVSFSYPGTTTATLKNISFVIAPGSKLALVGENGAGKTTLIKLLLRQYMPTSGTITVNGINIRELDQNNYYAAIGNLSQDFLIINHLTIKDNLLLGLSKTPSDEDISLALRLAGADGIIAKLKHKIDSRLDTSFDDGTNLSGGQYQRLGVARTLLRAGDLMILDEPTSAIDAKAEYEIFNNIYKAHGSKTTLIISHRFSTVRKADKIIVLEKGKVIEYGSHEELIKYGGLYKEMFDLQAEGYK